MALVIIQVGQCGNQIGERLLSKLHAHLNDDDASQSSGLAAARSTFFRAAGKVARAVLVDTEPKAIQATLKAAGSGWRYDARSQVCCKGAGGAANNWAFGYHEYGSQSADALIAAVQREVEYCDHLGGLLVLHSGAGGTGSGLGSYITEQLADAFPQTALMNAIVCPYTAGEVRASVRL